MAAPIPCYWCSRVAFCSAECRNIACQSHHKWECPIIDFLFASGMSITCYIALRMVTQNGLQFFKDKKEELEELAKDDSPFLFTDKEKKIFDPTDYRSVFTMVTHSDIRPPDDLVHRSLMGLFLLKCLSATGFFGREEIGTKGK